jgi:hypothetical protein
MTLPYAFIFPLSIQFGGRRYGIFHGIHCRTRLLLIVPASVVTLMAKRRGFWPKANTRSPRRRQL